MPDINLDEFKVCFSGRWLTGELVAINLATAFGMFLHPDLQHSFTPGALTYLVPRVLHVVASQMCLRS